MKKDLKLSKWMLCASTGALMYTASLVYGNDPGAERQSEQQQSQQSQSYQSESQSSQSLEIKSEEQAQGVEISEPSGAERPVHQKQFSGEKHAQAASFGTLERASDLIGREVESQQGEKLGDIKDVVIDLQSGRVPFAVLSSGGIAGVGDRLLAIPPTALNAQGEDAFTLSMSQDQLRNAPTFQRNQWPERMDQQWSANVYQFYGQQPYWQTTSGYRSSSDFRRYEQRSTIQEPSGAEVRTEFHGPSMHEPSGAGVYSTYESRHVTRYPKTILGDNNTMDDINQGSGTRGGAEDLTDFDEKANMSKDAISEYHGAHTGEYRSYGTAYGPGYGSTVVEPSAAARGEWQRGGTHYGTTGTTTTREQQQYRSEYQQQQQPMKSQAGGAKLHRASDLIGLNVRNAQGQTIGEIKDVVIDVNSGHIAFIAFEGSGEFGQPDQWMAVPASMFSGMAQRQVTLNASPDRLRNAPSFEEGSWDQATSEEFVSRIYSHYGQRPYWRSSSTFQEPAGTPREESYQQHEQEFKQEKTETEIQSQEVEEPSGAEKTHDQQLDQSGSEQKELESPEREISEPSGAEPSSTSIQGEESALGTESSAELESEAQASAPSAGVDVSGQSQEQSGAAISEEAGAQAEVQADPALQSSEQPAEATVTEPSGASTELPEQPQVSSEPAGAATASDQTGANRLVENVRTELQRDTASGAQNIQVTTEQGKIVLKGTVNSEADKQRIEEKVQDLVIDNQLQIQGGAGQSPSQP